MLRDFDLRSISMTGRGIFDQFLTASFNFRTSIFFFVSILVTLALSHGSMYIRCSYSRNSPSYSWILVTIFSTIRNLLGWTSVIASMLLRREKSKLEKKYRPALVVTEIKQLRIDYLVFATMLIV